MLSETKVQAFQEVIEAENPAIKVASESVLKIVAYKKTNPIDQGAAVVIEGGKVFTAYHVIGLADSLVLYTHAKGSRLASPLMSGEILVNEKFDIAVFPMPEVFDDIVPQIKCATLGNKTAKAFLIGFPSINYELQWPLYGQKPIILSVDLIWQHEHELTTIFEESAEIVLEGASGGALVNNEGSLLGIIHSGMAFKNANNRNSHITVATSIDTAIKTLLNSPNRF